MTLGTSRRELSGEPDSPFLCRARGRGPPSGRISFAGTVVARRPLPFRLTLVVPSRQARECKDGGLPVDRCLWRIIQIQQAAYLGAGEAMIVDQAKAVPDRISASPRRWRSSTGRALATTSHAALPSLTEWWEYC